MNDKYNIEKITTETRELVNRYLIDNWYSTDIVIRGKIIDGKELNGYLIKKGNRIIALITYKEYNDYIEIVSLNSDIRNQGIGSLLIKKVEELAKQKDYRRIIVVTTNDNINALDFYQKRGYNIIKTYYNSMDEVRKIKPNVPLIGENGIPLKDEIELQKEL